MHLKRFEPWSIVDLLHRDLDRLAQSRFGADDSDRVPPLQWAVLVALLPSDGAPIKLTSGSQDPHHPCRPQSTAIQTCCAAPR